MKFPIYNRFSNQVQFTAEIYCPEGTSTDMKIGLSVKWAILNGANLIGSSLYGAILNGAILNGACLDGAILNGANLSGAR